MKKTILAGVCAVTMGLVAGAATAQTPAPQGAEQGQPSRAHGLRGDADRDGRLTQAEFIEGRLARLTALDADGDGVVTPEEMRAAMQARRAEQADKRFARLDANGDGSISRAEFDAQLQQRGPRGERVGRPGRGHGPMHAGRRGPGGPRGPEGVKREPGPIVIADVRAKLTEQFAELDANSDGVVTAEEQRAARAAHRQERRDRRGGARPMQQPASPSPASE